MKKRLLRIGATLVVTGLCTAYIVWKIDVSRTAHILAHANVGYFLLAVAIMVGSVWPMAWRWQKLLHAREIRDRLPWLVRAYFVAYTAGQILPTAVGGDAVRIYETAKRHTGRGGDVAGSVLLERALGGAATLALAAVGFVLALGQNYDVAAYLWIEFAFVIGTVVLAVALFARRARPLLARTVPFLRLIRVDRPIRAAYEGIHSYRDHPGLLGGVFALTLNGIAVRESFFVSFLGGLHVDADKAFATGFLFFAVTLCLSVPGGILLAWQSIRGLLQRPVTPARSARPRSGPVEGARGNRE